MTKTIRNEIQAIRNNDWSNFIKHQCPNPSCSKPFWQKIEKIKGKTSNNQIPVLKLNKNIKRKVDYLNVNYINKSLINNNELLIDLYKEYIGYRESRQLKYKTLFCNYVNEIKYHVSSSY